MARVIWEDEDLLALDKPSGLHSAPLRAGEGESLLDQALALRPALATLPGRKTVEPGLLHRLDGGTSGIVLFAKTESAFKAMLDLQEGEGILKEYLALSAPAEPDLPGARPSRGSLVAGAVTSFFRPWGPGARRVAPLAEAEGRSYRTEILREEGREIGEGRRGVLIHAALTRGFRHQVRAHLAWLGMPILGDALYAPEGLKEWRPPGKGSSRLMLHAFALEFAHPRDSRPLRLECPAPPEFPPD